MNTLILRLMCALHRRFQKFPGRWRMLNWIEKRRARLSELPSGAVAMGHGISLFISLQDRYDGQKYYIHGINVREPLGNLISQALRPGDTMLDIGANVGYFSALASLLVGKGGKVMAFEASPRMIPRLQVLAQNNPHQNIEVIPNAASSRAGEVEFFMGPEEHSGISSMRNLANDTLAAVRVPAITIDSLLPTLPTVRLVKIDVEGAEMLVLEGMQALLDRDRPYLVVEVTGKFLKSLGSSKQELVRFMEERGYTAYRVGREVIPYEHIEEYQCDVLFVPPGCDPLYFDQSRDNFADLL